MHPTNFFGTVLDSDASSFALTRSSMDLKLSGIFGVTVASINGPRGESLTNSLQENGLQRTTDCGFWAPRMKSRLCDTSFRKDQSLSNKPSDERVSTLNGFVEAGIYFAHD
jgi:hypothetical protein